MSDREDAGTLRIRISHHSFQHQRVLMLTAWNMLVAAAVAEGDAAVAEVLEEMEATRRAMRDQFALLAPDADAALRQKEGKAGG